MSISGKLDAATFENSIRRLAAAYRRPVEEVFKATNRKIVLDCIKMTPPFGKAPITESFSEQKRIGERAVTNQVKRAFQPIKELDIYKRKDTRKLLDRYMRSRDLDAIELILRGFRLNFRGVVLEPTEDALRQVRGRRGRVSRGATFKTINSPNRLIAQKFRNVGIAKRGWVKAFNALTTPTYRVKLPAWLDSGRGTGTGIFSQSGNADKTVLIIGNGIPYIQDSGQELAILSRAMKNREPLLEKEIRIVQSKVKREAGLE